MSFGRDLQLERENRGISLQDLAEDIKVPSRFLSALESDDFSGLPGGVFNKGIVSSYCRHLGLDEEPWLTRFASNVPAETGEQDWTEFAENVKRTRIQTSAKMRRRWWGVLLLLIVVVALAWAVWHFIIRPSAFVAVG